MKINIYYQLLMGYLLLVIPLLGLSQTQVHGTIINLSGLPMPYASVLLLSPSDSSLLWGTVSMDNGGFRFDSIPDSSYLLSVSMVGYRRHFENLIIASEPKVHIKPITLYESGEELEEVTVSAQKPLYEKQIDRMI